MVLNKVYLCNHDQLNEIPDNGDYIIMDAPDTLQRIISMCIRHGLKDVHCYIPKDYMLNYLDPIDIRP